LTDTARLSLRFQSRRGVQALLESPPVLRSGLRVLDAGCGFGMATFALLDALRRRKLSFRRIDAFDLTPVMLARFKQALRARGIAPVQFRQADVLALETLPPSWTDYDLILATSMLEYLPKQDLPRALIGLRGKLAPDGRLIAMITRKTAETKLLIEWWWRADDTAGFHHVVFRRFTWCYFCSTAART